MVSTESTQPSLNNEGGKTPPPPSVISHSSGSAAATTLIADGTTQVVIKMEISVAPGKTPPPPTHRIEIVVNTADCSYSLNDLGIG
jgi:hypothetical protein